MVPLSSGTSECIGEFSLAEKTTFPNYLCFRLDLSICDLSYVLSTFLKIQDGQTSMRISNQLLWWGSTLHKSSSAFRGISQKCTNPLNLCHWCNSSGRTPFGSREVSKVLVLLYSFPSYLESLSVWITECAAVRNTVCAWAMNATERHLFHLLPSSQQSDSLRSISNHEACASQQCYLINKFIS